MKGDITNNELSSDIALRAFSISITTSTDNDRVDADGDFKRVGEPTEAALKVVAEKLCGTPTSRENAFQFEKDVQKRLKAVAQLDFTSQRKAMSTIVRGYRNDSDLLLKGAPDRII